MDNGMLQKVGVSFTGLDPLHIIATLLVIVLVPLSLHLLIYRSSDSTSLPTFLLLGACDSGKTTLLTLLEQGKQTKTCTSQSPLSVECSLPVNSIAASSHYRSDNDPSKDFHKKFLLADTPGHGKLRHFALKSIIEPQNLVGIIFMVDAADLNAGSLESPDHDRLQQTAAYLHEILLLLQKNALVSNARKAKSIPLLIAANKQDLFTALPAPLVKTSLEKQIDRIRESKSKGLLDSGIGMNDMQDERERIGDPSQPFRFSQMDDVNVAIQILGGNAAGAGGPHVKLWWDWIAANL